MGEYTGQSYQPSNSEDGFYFMEKFCDCCLHEKWNHTQNDEDKKCPILSDSFCFNKGEKGYPKEWVYDKNDNPVCTAHVKFDWGGDDGEFNESPNPPEPEDPNQMCLPFILDEMEYEKENKKQVNDTYTFSK